MRVKDVMTVDVITTTEETSLRDAALLMAERGISGLPVVVPGGTVTGVISEADVLAKERRADDHKRGPLHRRVPDPKHEARLVGETMSVPAVTVPSYASITTAAGRMLEHGVNRLPVVDSGQLRGIVTRADLVRAFVRPDVEIANDAREQIALQQALVNDPNPVAVSVTAGDAVLSGQVLRRSDAELIPQIVRQVPGVVEVRAELSWSEAD